MTKEEFERLRLTNQGYFTFVLYTGDEKTGIIVEDPRKMGNYYILSVQNIKLYNDDPSILVTVGERVSLATIDSYSQVHVEPSSFFRFSTTRPVEQLTPVIGAKKMIILGAGASFDFTFDQGFSDEGRPPLTNNLFDDRFDKILDLYPGAKQLASPLLMADDIERFFQDQWDMIKEHFALEQMNQLINTQYYIQHLFMDVSNRLKNIKRNNYTNLVSLASQHIARSAEPLLITSFNYDTLFEQAITQHYGYTYNSMQDYINVGRKMLFFKPHGSWNWIREFKFRGSYSAREAKPFTDMLFEEKKSYAQIFKELDLEIKVSNEIRLHNNVDRSTPFLPQLLIPYTDKDEFVMPEDHRKMLEANIGTIDEVLIIGWKGTEQRFKTLLAQMIGPKPIKITVVNKDDKTIEIALSDVLPNATWNYHGTFTTFMKECMNTKKLFN